MEKKIMYGVEMYDRISDETFIYAYRENKKHILERKIEQYKKNLEILPDITKPLNNIQRQEFNSNQTKIHMIFEHSHRIIRNVKNILTDENSRRFIESSDGELIILIDRVWSGF